ncbi:MAG: sulfurtransferase TusA family protein [Rhodospirillales bacterium]|nr:sulfurtransferase TusA family protein [Rhodospirillales bacterium]
MQKTDKKPDFFIDITGEVCPLTFVKTKLLLERAHAGQTVLVRLKGTEPLANVPRAVRDHGHLVLELAPEDPAREGPDAVHRLLIRKT